MNHAEIKKLVRTHYDLDVSIKALVGYEDQNFLLTTDDQQRFILKFSKLDQALDILTAQEKALACLQKASNQAYLFPKFIPTKSGQAIVAVRYAGDEARMRMLNFIDGTFFAETLHTHSLFQSLGRFLATMNRTLAQVAIPTLAQRTQIWDLQYFPDCKAYLPYIQDPKSRSLVNYYLQQYELFVEAKVKTLRKSVLHNDANDWNLLTKADKLVGIIDFGDLAYTQLIHELAIALAYALMKKEEPLPYAQSIIGAYHEVYPLEAAELEVLYYLVAARLCTSVCMSAYASAQTEENDYLSISEKDAWDLLNRWISINPLQAANAFKSSCGFPTTPPKDPEQQLTRRFQHISPALSVSYQADPIQMERAAFQYMYDDRGRTFLDGVNNICHVGHCHPQVVQAAQKQIALLNTNTRYLYDSLAEYAELLCAKFPDRLNKVFFVNSGSAATDLAYRMATHFTQRQHILVVDHAYHGNTNVGIQLSPYKYEGKGGPGQAKHIYKLPAPDGFRGKYRYEEQDLGIKYGQLAEAVLAKAAAANEPIGAFICESILGCGGQIVLPPAYLKTVYELVRAQGGVCIADEVQVGFGRVGSHFWAFEMQEVVPDIVILGKPMGNGHPMGAVVTTEAIADAFNNGMEFFSSFGGNPVSCEIGKAVLQVIETEQLQAHALTVGEFLRDGFQQLKEQFPIIGDVRGSGLFWGLELVENQEQKTPATEAIKKIIHRMKQEGMLLSIDGPLHNVIKFKPPLPFSQENAAFLIRKLSESFAVL